LKLQYARLPLALFSTTSAPYVPPSGGDLGPGYDFKFRM